MSEVASERRLIILAGGGPAPGINGVIAAVTIEAIQQGMTVLGCQDGFKYLVQGRTDHVRPLSVADVEPYQIRGGSMLGTSRTNPAAKEETMQRLLQVLEELKVTDLVTIGGDDTGYSASQVAKRVGNQIRVAHVPKTIDNDLPLPGTTPTFGFESARHYGVGLVRALLEDARTTSRWYLVVSMGRAAGHLALGVGKAVPATLTLIAEALRGKPVTLERIRDLIIGSIVKQKAHGRAYGVVVLAEGLIEAIGEEALLAALGGEEALGHYGNIVRDPHGHLRLGEIEFGRIVKDALSERLKELGLKVTFVTKDIGYELRCVDPIPFDAEYTRDLGYSAVRFLCSTEAERYGAVISFVQGQMRPLPFDDILDPTTRRMRPRLVDTSSIAFASACQYMKRLDLSDLEDPQRLAALAEAAGMTTEQFREQFQAVAKDGCLS